MSLKIIRVIYSEYQNLLDTLPCTTIDKYRYVNGNKRTNHCFKRCQTLTFETNCTLQVSLPDLEFPSYMSYTHTIISNRQHEHELN